MDVSAKGPLLQVEEHFEFEIEKVSGSRFLAILTPADSAERVVAVQQELRRLHPHARHVCFAFVGNSASITRFSDDGEPAKTAGMPMLRVLLGASLRHSGALVVRYFGGVKLGTGGLVRAYTQAVREAIERAPLTPVVQQTVHVMRVGYAEEPKLRHFCDKFRVALDVEYGGTELAVVLRGERECVQNVVARVSIQRA